MLKYNNNLQMICSNYDLIDHQVRNFNLQLLYIFK